jgi:Tfp pilus assembly protein PilF
MRAAALIVGVALCASVANAGEVGRFRPATPGYVVLKVPASAGHDPIAVLEQRHAQGPGDEAVAAQLAESYLARARAEREPRYFARAEALVRPWVSQGSASVSTTAGATSARASTLRVQADILQNRHDFASAVTLLDRAIALDPRDTGARLMRASVKMVGGHAAEARADCAEVLASGESSAGTICLAQVLAATGGLARAETLLKTLVSRDEVGTGGAAPAALPVRAWALWLLADFADRAGDSRAAEARLRTALDADPQNEGVRSALSDLLISRGAYREALALVDLPAPSIGLLARRARAQQQLHDPALEQTRAAINDLVTLTSRRGDPPHLREEALIALDVEHDAPRALELAKTNFETQRETIDIRLLVRTARACGDTATLRSVTQWLKETGYEDRELPGAPTSGAATSGAAASGAAT